MDMAIALRRDKSQSQIDNNSDPEIFHSRNQIRVEIDNSGKNSSLSNLFIWEEPFTISKQCKTA